MIPEDRTDLLSKSFQALETDLDGQSVSRAYRVRKKHGR